MGTLAPIFTSTTSGHPAHDKYLVALGLQEGISEMKLNNDLVHSNEKEKWQWEHSNLVHRDKSYHNTTRQQSDQIGRFLNLSASRFLLKLAQMYGIFEPILKHHFSSKNWWAAFRVTFNSVTSFVWGIIGLFFIRSSPYSLHWTGIKLKSKSYLKKFGPNLCDTRLILKHFDWPIKNFSF